MSGTDVIQLQTFLRSQGLFTYPSSTGYFGALTRQAIEMFQKKYGISPDGIVTGQTQTKILELMSGVSELSPSVSHVETTFGMQGTRFVIQVSWQAVPGSITYGVQRRVGSSGPFVTVASDLSVPYYYDYDISSGTTYFYLVVVSSSVSGSAIGTMTSAAITPVVHGGGGSRNSSTTSSSSTPPPVISAGSPSGSLAFGTTATTISVTTNDDATCKYSTVSGSAYASMTSFDVTGMTSHSASISGLTNGTSYTYYVKCQDVLGNTDTSDYAISFSVSGDTIAPTVSLTAPSDGATVGGSAITISATASDNVGVVGVQFKLDGSTNIGTEDLSSPYSVTWDSTLVSDGTHTITAVARDAAGNTTTSTAVSITVDNTGPVISSVSSGTPTDSGTTITWTTNENANSQVEYGTTTSYGQTTTLDSALVTSHSVALSGLTAQTTYHYRVISSDSIGNQSVSSDGTFTTTLPAWVPVASGTPADMFADFSTENTTDHYWASSSVFSNAAAWLSHVVVSLTRSSSGYYVNSSKYLAAAAAGAPRYSYDQMTGASLGLLLEGLATNYLASSENAESSWLKTNVTSTEGATVAPDGATTGIRLVETAATGVHSISEKISSSNIISVYAKAGEQNWIWINANDGTSNHYTWFNVSTGVVGTNDGNNTPTIIQYPNGWYLCTVRTTASTVLAAFGIAPSDATSSYAGNTADGEYFWGMDARNIYDGTLDSYIQTVNPTSPSLLNYWNMDEIGTGSRADATGNGGTLTNNGGATDGTGLHNNATTFVRASSQYLSFSDTSQLQPPYNSSFGFSTWVKFSSFQNYEDIISRWGGTTNTDGFTLEADSTGHIGFYVGATDGSHSAVWGPALSTGTWYNVVAWYDASIGKVGISVNGGTPVYSAAFSAIVNNQVNVAFDIGRAATGAWTSYFDGSIDETAFFAGAPATGDLTAIYNGGTPESFSSWSVLHPTRVADSYIRTLPSSPTAITEVIAGRTPAVLPLTYQILYHMDNGTEADDFEAYRDSTGHMFVEVHNADASQALLDLGFIANNTDFKIAFRGGSNDLAASLNGGAVVSSTHVTWPTDFTTDRLGVNIFTYPRSWNSTIKSNAVFLRAVSDLDLQSLSN